MKVKLILLVAVMSLTLSVGAFAAVENIRVSGDINAEAVIRDLGMGAEESIGSSSETFVLSQVRLRIDADLTEGVGATIGLINERVWGTSGSDSGTDVDLDLAYIQLDDFMHQPMMVRIGRQNLRYGNALIIGDSGIAVAADSNTPSVISDLSLRKSFDAARVVLDYAPYTLDLIYAKIDEGNTHLRDDVNLWGANLAYDWADYNGITEVYGFYVDKGRDASGVQQDYREDVTVFGARTQLDLDDHWTLGAEGAYQFGKLEESRLRAYAGQMNAEYRFLDVNNSKIGASFTYLSGDSRSGSRSNAWDPLYEDQVPAEIINKLFENTNLMYTQLKGSMMPQEDVTLGLQWTWAKLANSLAGTPSISPVDGYSVSLVVDEKDLGNEVNAYMLYDYTEDVQIKLIGAWFMPGDLFHSDNDSVAYSIRTGVSVNF